MRILQLHCSYAHSGGEDVVADAEADYLLTQGHQVKRLLISNADVLAGGFLRVGRELVASAWNRRAAEHVRDVIRSFRPDVMHVHNIWFSLSPSVFGVAKAMNVPTVFSLHNYRLLCPGGLLMRKGSVCELCSIKSLWRGIVRRCYRSSALQTAAVVRMVSANRRWGTWTHLVDAYIALTEFSRAKFIEGGLPAEKIHVKPNMLPHDPGRSNEAGNGAVFVGRISDEKGVNALLAAWGKISTGQLVIIGDGPELQEMRTRTQRLSNVKFTGPLGRDMVMSEIKQAAFLIMPSIWYECFPIVLLEAFACGRPLLASRLGAMAELVEDGKTGLLFNPGDPDDLAVKAQYMLTNSNECRHMGYEARKEFENKYAAERNYIVLMEIYQKAIERNRANTNQA